MLSKNKTIELVEGFFQEGFLCSEAVLLTLNKLQKVESEIIPRIATGFGAGIGRHGEVCGALTGAVMGLGLQFGRTHPSETPNQTSPYEFSHTMVNLFVARFGHIRCRDLLGLDILSEEGRQTYTEEKLWEKKCHEFILTAVGLAYDLLEAKTTD